MSERDITKRSLAVGVVFKDEDGELWDEDADLFDGKTELEPIVDRDLNAFDKFYSETLANNSLSKFERAAIKTYLAWKLKVADGT